MNSPLVTVIMPVYNCEHYVKDAIKSILNQTYAHFELLIIDDASTDSTLTIIKEIKDSRINLTEKKENTGYTNSLNYGLSVAKGNYVARMDGDDISLPMRLEKQVTFMEANPDVIVCGTSYNIIGRDKIKEFPKSHEDIKVELLQNTCFAHPTVMIRKKVLDRHDIFYDTLKEPAEDYALWVTLLKYGKLHNLNEVLLCYRIHVQQVSHQRRDLQLKSKLATRIDLLSYLDIELNVDTRVLLGRALLCKNLRFKQIKAFLKLKDTLIEANEYKFFFKKKPFEVYLNNLEENTLKHYFLKRNQYKIKIISHYLKLYKQRSFKLPIKTVIVIFSKSIIGFKKHKELA